MSVDWQEIEQQIAIVTKGRRRPVSVAFLDGEPAKVARFEGSEPSSCSFWRLTTDGRTPDVVLSACKPAGAMLLQEAASRAGVGTGMPALGRPTCMALPTAFEHGTITSLGCIGNRV